MLTRCVSQVGVDGSKAVDPASSASAAAGSEDEVSQSGGGRSLLRISGFVLTQIAALGKDADVAKKPASRRGAGTARGRGASKKQVLPDLTPVILS